MSAEKNVVRRAAIRHECWSWAESCSPPRRGEDDQECTRMIDIGERYVSSTIFPGHESGCADGGYGERIKWVDGQIEWERYWIPGRPSTNAMCLPCAMRWENTRHCIPVGLVAA